MDELEAFALVGIIFAPWLLIEFCKWAADWWRNRPRLVPCQPERPKTLEELIAEQILEDAKRATPIDTGRLRAGYVEHGGLTYAQLCADLEAIERRGREHPIWWEPIRWEELD